MTSFISLSILTLNVWFDLLELKMRTKLIITEILRQRPDVVCLQEVLPQVLTILKEHKEISSIYSFSNFEPGHGYGNVTLVKHKHNPEFETFPLPSKMGRKLTLAHLNQRNSYIPHISVGNVHLESLNNQETRELQLEFCRLHLQPGCSVLVGDFNISADDAIYRTRMSEGVKEQKENKETEECDQATEMDTTKPQKDSVGFDKKDNVDADASSVFRIIQNDAILRILPHHQDAWLQQTPIIRALLEAKEEHHLKESAPSHTTDIDGIVDELGYTFDVAINNMSNKNTIERKRIDRIMTSLDPEKFEFLNMSRIGTSIFSTGEGGRIKTIYPSDHFGLLYSCLVHTAGSSDNNLGQRTSRSMCSIS